MAEDILLVTLNSTYQHAAFGLRCIYANMEELQPRTRIVEFTTALNVNVIAERLLELKPRIVGLGVYIWNARQSLELVALLKKVAPEITIVLGGPEVSYESETQKICELADYVVKGEGDLQFRELCLKILNGGAESSPKFLAPVLPEIAVLKSPYGYYNDEDVRNRVIYVEASRGCPYKCSYCLSSLDKSVRNFPLDAFLADMEKLIERGVRQFKFVDRTFNLSPSISTRILEFFLGHIEKELFLHFEMVPDRLPDELKALIQRFPAGSLQFEIGIQTWNPEVAKNVNRRQNYEAIRQNLRFLREETTVHTHVDLIFGLPGETFASFARGFNEVLSLQADEIQVGWLKRLKGTPITRDEAAFGLVYSEESPYTLLRNNTLSFAEIQTLGRFGKFWDLYANSGRFPRFMDRLHVVADEARADGEAVADFFSVYQRFCTYLNTRHAETYGIALERLAESAYRFLVDELAVPALEAGGIIFADYCIDKKRDVPRFLKAAGFVASTVVPGELVAAAHVPERQRRHLTH